MRKIVLGLALAALVPLASAPAHAGGFIGASWGRTSLDAHVEDLSFSDSDVGWKVMGGFGPKFFGFEAFYVDFGRFSDSDFDADVTGWDASFYGRLPIKKFELFAKVGLIYWDGDAILGSGPRRSDSGTDVSWGAGAGWTFGEHFGIRVEYEVFEVSPNWAKVDNLTLISLGIKYQF